MLCYLKPVYYNGGDDDDISFIHKLMHNKQLSKKGVKERTNEDSGRCVWRQKKKKRVCTDDDIRKGIFNPFMYTWVNFIQDGNCCSVRL